MTDPDPLGCSNSRSCPWVRGRGSDGTAGAEGPSVYLGDAQGGWRPASNGLKVFSFTARGIAFADINGDGHVDLIAAGSIADTALYGNLTSDELDKDEFGDDEFGLFLFTGDSKGNWSLRTDSGLPASGWTRPSMASNRSGGPDLSTF